MGAGVPPPPPLQAANKGATAMAIATPFEKASDMPLSPMCLIVWANLAASFSAVNRRNRLTESI
ncbi:hypothetical protein X949_4863 [Burkholderia pseudomallei MSHR5609]|nr:hypothetical protein X941_5511 [Burkholderia pseudomallei MSHR5569]KGS55804.1 hypothetical protein X949_4863 [Burkholderia pseudomallei MSHR5609]KGS61258.1 hypothetical protein X990_5379 [Burkholderia pseudomallei MSHR4868]KGW26523.1 hypothetical protein Y047_6116 [Burkholderia pseudomallei MSHR3016]KGW68227.1 hypothetical protein Y042_5903 [Burkholderia pseudomallei MSHR1357]KGX51069.1 hypothetical protein Y025_5263 [Burkholderia pseudomallei TSV32]